MGAYYANLIYKLQEAIKGKLPGSLSKGIPLNRDNAPSHRSAVAKSPISEAGSELVEYTPHSPDLAPSDYRLFPKLRDWC